MDGQLIEHLVGGGISGLTGPAHAGGDGREEGDESKAGWVHTLEHVQKATHFGLQDRGAGVGSQVFHPFVGEYARAMNHPTNWTNRPGCFSQGLSNSFPVLKIHCPINHFGPKLTESLQVLTHFTISQCPASLSHKLCRQSFGRILASQCTDQFRLRLAACQTFRLRTRFSTSA